MTGPTPQPTITHTHTWDGTHNLPDWLHWDGHLVLPGRDDTTRPQPGWMLVRWSDGHVTVASPQVAARVYGPDGMRGRLQRAEAELAGRAADAVDQVRLAVYIADDEDRTDWQRGYRACATRVLATITADEQRRVKAAARNGQTEEQP